MSLVAANNMSSTNARRPLGAKKMPLGAHVDNRANLKHSAPVVDKRTTQRYPTAHTVHTDRMQQHQMTPPPPPASYTHNAYATYPQSMYSVVPSPPVAVEAESPREVPRCPVPPLNTAALAVVVDESPRTQAPVSAARGGVRAKANTSFRTSRRDNAEPAEIMMPEEGEERARVQHKVAQREKQLSLGKQTQGYRNYIMSVPVECRDPNNANHVSTPRATWDISKRRFDELTRHWRRILHNWDHVDPVDYSAQGASMMSPEPHASEGSFMQSADPYTFLNSSEEATEMVNMSAESGETTYEEFQELKPLPPLIPTAEAAVPPQPVADDVPLMTPIARTVDMDVSCLSLYDMADYNADTTTDTSLGAPSDECGSVMDYEELNYFMTAIC